MIIYKIFSLLNPIIEINKKGKNKIIKKHNFKYKLLNIFILYLNSYYSYKLIKHIYLNIFSKYKRNINNLYLYIKKVIIMSVFFLIMQKEKVRTVIRHLSRRC